VSATARAAVNVSKRIVNPKIALDFVMAVSRLGKRKRARAARFALLPG